MADKLTADQFDTFTGRNLRERVVRTLTINNDSISLTDITAFARKWGKLKTSVYNISPADRGRFILPVLTIEMDNSTSAFDLGGIIFPSGRDDFASAVAHLTIEIGGTTFLDFEGAVLEPEYDPSGAFNLILEHPLAALSRRKWIREDRIGGDTGIDYYFNS